MTQAKRKQKSDQSSFQRNQCVMAPATGVYLQTFSATVSGLSSESKSTCGVLNVPFDDEDGDQTVPIKGL